MVLHPALGSTSCDSGPSHVNDVLPMTEHRDAQQDGGGGVARHGRRAHGQQGRSDTQRVSRMLVQLSPVRSFGVDASTHHDPGAPGTSAGLELALRTTAGLGLLPGEDAALVSGKPPEPRSHAAMLIAPEIAATRVGTVLWRDLWRSELCSRGGMDV